MPFKQSAFKHLRQTKKRTERNARTKKDILYHKRQLLKAVTGGDNAKAGEWMKKLTTLFDKAAQKGVVKKNTAARNKSRLTKKVNAMNATK